MFRRVLPRFHLLLRTTPLSSCACLGTTEDIDAYLKKFTEQIWKGEHSQMLLDMFAKRYPEILSGQGRVIDGVASEIIGFKQTLKEISLLDCKTPEEYIRKASSYYLRTNPYPWIHGFSFTFLVRNTVLNKLEKYEGEKIYPIIIDAIEKNIGLDSSSSPIQRENQKYFLKKMKELDSSNDIFIFMNFIKLLYRTDSREITMLRANSNRKDGPPVSAFD